MKKGALWGCLVLTGFFLSTGGACGSEAPAKTGPAAAEKGMVASAHPLACKVGVDIMKKGGNAVDAAVATAFALGVVEPYASGIGGGGFMLIYLADRKKAISLDYREVAPALATPEMFLSAGGKPNLEEMKAGPLSIGVPGTVAGLAFALKEYGTMDLGAVMRPAVELAEKGYEVNRVLHELMKTYTPKLSRFGEGARVFLKNGDPYKAGEKITLKDLGKTYRLIAARGPDAFYKGEIAEAIEKEMKRSEGLITRKDLAAYRPTLREPVKGRYRGYEILSMGPPSSGGTHLIQLLNILEGFDMAALGHNSAESIQIWAEGLKRVFADRSSHMGDPDFIKIPLKNLLSKTYAEKVRKEISSGAGGDAKRGEPGKESDQTTHLSVVDGKRNLVALTQTLGSFFASGVMVPGTGMLLNNQLADADPKTGRPNSVEAGKRPLSSMSPTLVLKDGKPFLSIGMPGAERIISVLPQILINLLDYGMNIQQAIDAPRVHCMTDKIWMESRVPEEVREKLSEKGYKLGVREEFDLWFGGAQGVLLDRRTGKIQGAADPRREGAVLGY